MNKKERFKEIEEEMTELQNSCDLEVSHVRGDELLCEALEMCGHPAIVAAFRDLDKLYV